jgi:site-specific DNA-methyltransferase (cytosine-N4-specific)
MKSDLPNSSQFSPTQTSLPELLLVIKSNQLDREKVTQGIAKEFFLYSKDSYDLAKNTLFALSEYGLLDKPVDDQSYASLTELGEALFLRAISNDLDGMYAEFARHILLNLRGLELLSCAEDISLSGRKPTKALIVKELRSRGIYHPPNGTHANGMRQWLEKAGVVGKDQWVPVSTRLESILNLTDKSELDQYASLSTEQVAFAKAFARLNVEEARSNEVAKYASELFGVEFPEGGLPQSTLFQLRDAGLITCEKTTGGQGAKPYIVRPTDTLRNEFIEPILETIEHSIGIQYRKLIRMPYEDILSGLKSKSTHEKGLALEALAFYLGKLLNLDFVKWRLRSNKTGGAELDIIMEGTHLIFSRWQIQCKNSKQASLDDVAKEVGVAQVIKSNVIMIVTTGNIGSAAKDFAQSIMKETSLNVILISGNELRLLKKTPTAIIDILKTQAIDAMNLKRIQVVD